MSDGAAQVHYEVVSFQNYHDHDRFLVQLKLPFMPVTLDDTPPVGYYL